MGRRVELIFDPFNLEQVEVRYLERSFGLAVPHKIGRRSHPMAKAAPEPGPPSGIDYLDQRVTLRYALPPMSPEETAGYYATIWRKLAARARFSPTTPLPGPTKPQGGSPGRSTTWPARRSSPPASRRLRSSTTKRHALPSRR